MLDFLSRHKRVFVIVGCLICLISIIATVRYKYRPEFLEDVLGYIITPAQKGMTATSRWFSNKLGFFGDIEDVRRENELLRLDNEYLQQEIKRLKLVETENKKLSDLYRIDQKYSEYPKVGAEIISRDMVNWFDKFYIDKGKNQGIYENMVVLASGGLVGRITKSMATYSVIVSIIDDNSRISAKCLRTEDIGFVKGDVDLMKDGLCRLDFLELGAEIMKGDEIVTSNYGNIYPPGITIGYVEEVRTDPGGLTKYAVIKPVVDFKHIETVLIINEKIDHFENDDAEQDY